MRLTRKKTIELCIELWTYLARTGKKKEAWPKWKKYGNASCDCWFCEYDRQRQLANHEDMPMCYRCIFGIGSDLTCFDLGYCDWNLANTIPARRKYAAIFLKKIKAIAAKGDKK